MYIFVFRRLLFCVYQNSYVGSQCFPYILLSTTKKNVLQNEKFFLWTDFSEIDFNFFFFLIMNLKVTAYGLFPFGYENNVRVCVWVCVCVCMCRFREIRRGRSSYKYMCIVMILQSDEVKM